MISYHYLNLRQKVRHIYKKVHFLTNFNEIGDNYDSNIYDGR